MFRSKATPHLQDSCATLCLLPSTFEFVVSAVGSHSFFFVLFSFSFVKVLRTPSIAQLYVDLSDLLRNVSPSKPPLQCWDDAGAQKGEPVQLQQYQQWRGGGKGEERRGEERRGERGEDKKRKREGEERIEGEERKRGEDEGEARREGKACSEEGGPAQGKTAMLKWAVK